MSYAAKEIFKTRWGERMAMESDIDTPIADDLVRLDRS